MASVFLGNSTASHMIAGGHVPRSHCDNRSADSRPLANCRHASTTCLSDPFYDTDEGALSVCQPSRVFSNHERAPSSYGSDDGSSARNSLVRSATRSSISVSTVENVTSLGLAFELEDGEFMDGHTLAAQISSSEMGLPSAVKPPFDKWLRTMKRNKSKYARQRHRAIDPRALLDTPEAQCFRNRQSRSQDATKCLSERYHKKSSSSSSTAFIEAVRSATVSLASFSIGPRSADAAQSSTRQSRDGRGESMGLDQVAVSYRAIQRRRILEELINTEESYVADIRFLLSVYNSFLASIRTVSNDLRVSIISNLTELVELHEILLGDLHAIVQDSEYSQTDFHAPFPRNTVSRHQRWASLDTIRVHPRGSSSVAQCQTRGIYADPEVGAIVAKAFQDRLPAFLAYEEYGAKYEIMVRDLASTRQTIPDWAEYQRGLENVAGIVNRSGNKKALLIGDLLVKPIQRVCKYPLLFAELLKHTPVYDGPEHHVAIDNVLTRLRETMATINKATNDPCTKSIMEITWRMQDRLRFSDESSVTYDSAAGQYMLASLYDNYLVLSLPALADNVYEVQATIGLDDLRVETCDNSKGIQCHTAAFSWKVVFEIDNQLYEVLLSACSAKEEHEWKSSLLATRTQNVSHEKLSILLRNARSLGTVFGKPGSVARRMSIKRATTVGGKNSLCQVLIHDSITSRMTSSGRSQSMLTTLSRLPTFAPDRNARCRLEYQLSDVWTKDRLPYPGMATRSRNEQFARATTATQAVIRKIGAARILKRDSSGSLSLKSFGKSSVHSDPLSNPGLTHTSSKSPYEQIIGEPLMSPHAQRDMPLFVSASPRKRKVALLLRNPSKEGSCKLKTNNSVTNTYLPSILPARRQNMRSTSDYGPLNRPRSSSSKKTGSRDIERMQRAYSESLALTGMGRTTSDKQIVSRVRRMISNGSVEPGRNKRTQSRGGFVAEVKKFWR